MDPMAQTLIVLAVAYCSWKWGVQHGRIALANEAPRTPEAMIDIREALTYVKDAREALERAESAWNRAQLVDALKSSQDFIGRAAAELEKTRAP